MQTIEQFFSCPYCGTNISMVLDLQEVSSEFIEDCERCCRPIEISYRVEEEVIVEFRADRCGE